MCGGSTGTHPSIPKCQAVADDTEHCGNAEEVDTPEPGPLEREIGRLFVVLHTLGLGQAVDCAAVVPVDEFACMCNDPRSVSQLLQTQGEELLTRAVRPETTPYP